MARPKEFEREAALEKAMQLFWQQGYEATSLSDLLSTMKIGRQSLYDTFGDKRALFVEALTHYTKRVDGRMAELRHAEDPVSAIRELFNDTVRNLTEPKQRRSCLLNNSCMELAAHDPGIRKQVNGTIRSIEGAFRSALSRAVEKGQLKKKFDVKGVATFLTCQASGLALLSKAEFSRSELQASANVALQVLE